MDINVIFLNEVTNPRSDKKNVARVYARMLGRDGVDWPAIDKAIRTRWDFMTLGWIKREAHSIKGE